MIWIFERSFRYFRWVFFTSLSTSSLPQVMFISFMTSQGNGWSVAFWTSTYLTLILYFRRVFSLLVLSFSHYVVLVFNLKFFQRHSLLGLLGILFPLLFNWWFLLESIISLILGKTVDFWHIFRNISLLKLFRGIYVVWEAIKLLVGPHEIVVHEFSIFILWKNLLEFSYFCVFSVFSSSNFLILSDFSSKSPYWDILLRLLYFYHDSAWWRTL